MSEASESEVDQVLLSDWRALSLSLSLSLPLPFFSHKTRLYKIRGNSLSVERDVQERIRNSYQSDEAEEPALEDPEDMNREKRVEECVSTFCAAVELAEEYRQLKLTHAMLVLMLAYSKPQ